MRSLTVLKMEGFAYDAFIILCRELFTVFLLIVIPYYLLRYAYNRLFCNSSDSSNVVMYTIDKNAHAPERATAWSAGYDLRSTEEVLIGPGRCVLVGTGVHMAIPKTMYGRVAPRSSLAFKHCIFVNAGVIDSDYTGEIKACLHNAGQSTFKLQEGERVAQLIFELKGDPKLVKVSELEETARGSGGFGSTGRF